MSDITLAGLASLQAQIKQLKDDEAMMNQGIDNAWLIFGAALVFLMQAGFALLEAGSVRSSSVSNILFKNCMDGVISAIVFWYLGWCFYMGTDSQSGFIGAGSVFLEDMKREEYSGWLFQWAFAAAASTIVSGAVAERCRLLAFFLYAVVLTGFVYPVVAHWGWSGCGWASAFNDGSHCHRYGQIGVMDFAGSGIVHMTGGFAALAGAVVLGPRRGVKTTLEGSDAGKQPVAVSEPVDAEGEAKLAWDFRFKPGVDDEQFNAHNVPLQALGVFILWFGWYGFNCVSTLVIAGGGSVAAKVACTTTIGAATGGIGALLFNRVLVAYKMREKAWDIGSLMNGILGGLVSITAGCAVVEPYGALVIGIVGGMVYVAASAALRGLEVDDPLDAFPVHGACGLWGLLSVGIFAHSKNVEAAYGVTGEISGFYDKAGGGNQFDVQLAFGVCVALWAGGISYLLFAALRKCGILRVSFEDEEAGVDFSEGMGAAYGEGGVGMVEYAPEATTIAPMD